MEHFAAGWIATPMEVVHAAQTFWWVHLPFSLLWLHRKWHNDPLHNQVRAHVRAGHVKRFTACGDCGCKSIIPQTTAAPAVHSPASQQESGWL